jgi:hypothetical protein
MILVLSAQYQASYGHCIGNSIVLDGSSQIIEPRTVAPQPRPTPPTKLMGSSKYTLLKDLVQVSYLLAQYQASSGL